MRFFIEFAPSVKRTRRKWKNYKVCSKGKTYNFRNKRKKSRIKRR